MVHRAERNSKILLFIVDNRDMNHELKNIFRLERGFRSPREEKQFYESFQHIFMKGPFAKKKVEFTGAFAFALSSQ